MKNAMQLKAVVKNIVKEKWCKRTIDVCLAMKSTRGIFGF